jgi:calnexin
MISNPEYKGIWSPNQIANPAFFEDKTPSDFTKIAGIGIELWTMTEDILFDNIFIGHDEAAAKTFAKETYHVKKPIEQEAEGSSPDEEDEEGASSFVEKLQLRLYEFIRTSSPRASQCKADSPDLAGFDIGHAVKTMPDIAAGLAAAAFTLLGILLATFGLIGSKPTTVNTTTVKAKKVPDNKAVVPVAPAGEEEKKALEDAGVELPKKRATKKD